MVIWILGKSGSGKTFYSKKLSKRFKKNCIIVDGDEVRDLYDNKLGYDIESRKKKYAKIY